MPSLGLSTQLSLSAPLAAMRLTRCLLQLCSALYFETVSPAGAEVHQFARTGSPAGPVSSCSCLPREARITSKPSCLFVHLFLFRECWKLNSGSHIVQEVHHLLSCFPFTLIHFPYTMSDMAFKNSLLFTTLFCLKLIGEFDIFNTLFIFLLLQVICAYAKH